MYTYLTIVLYIITYFTMKRKVLSTEKKMLFIKLRTILGKIWQCFYNFPIILGLGKKNVSKYLKNVFL